MKATLEHPIAAGSKKGAGPDPSLQPSGLWRRKTTVIAALSTAAIFLHLLLRFGFNATPENYRIPLLATLVFGGLPLLYDLLRKLLKREFGSDLLGGISIVTPSCWANIWPASPAHANARGSDRSPEREGRVAVNGTTSHGGKPG